MARLRAPGETQGGLIHSTTFARVRIRTRQVAVGAPGAPYLTSVGVKLVSDFGDVKATVMVARDKPAPRCRSRLSYKRSGAFGLDAIGAQAVPRPPTTPVGRRRAVRH